MKTNKIKSLEKRIQREIKLAERNEGEIRELHIIRYYHLGRQYTNIIHKHYIPKEEYNEIKEYQHD